MDCSGMKLGEKDFWVNPYNNQAMNVFFSEVWFGQIPCPVPGILQAFN